MLKDPVIQLSKFKDIDINVPFFNDLKNSYSEFTSWFSKKRDETVFVTYDNDNNLIGFMYLKNTIPSKRENGVLAAFPSYMRLEYGR